MYRHTQPGQDRMSRARWHISRDGEALTLTRRRPARFDVMAETFLPRVRMTPLAHQIRQDLWRVLQSLRGYSPVIELTPQGDQLRVRAGGQVDGRFDGARTEARIAATLECPKNRNRWIRWSQ